MTPDPELCRRYGTKVAESNIPAIAAAVLGTGLLLAAHRHNRQHQREVELDDLMARQLEDQRFRPARAGLRGAGGMPPDTTDYPGLGRLGNVQDLDPGFGGLPFDKGGSAKEAAMVSNALKGVARVALRGAGKGTELLGRGAQRLGQGLDQGFGATGRLVREAGPTLMADIPRGSAGLGGAVAQAGKAVEQGGQAVAGAAEAKALRPTKSLIGLGTKAKLLGGAGLLGAGYVGMKGLGAVGDYMATPAGYHHVGYIRPDVTDYGY